MTASCTLEQYRVLDPQIRALIIRNAYHVQNCPVRRGTYPGLSPSYVTANDVAPLWDGSTQPFVFPVLCNTVRLSLELFLQDSTTMRAVMTNGFDCYSVPVLVDKNMYDGLFLDGYYESTHNTFWVYDARAVVRRRALLPDSMEIEQNSIPLERKGSVDSETRKRKSPVALTSSNYGLVIQDQPLRNLSLIERRSVLCALASFIETTAIEQLTGELAPEDCMRIRIVPCLPLSVTSTNHNSGAKPFSEIAASTSLSTSLSSASSVQGKEDQESVQLGAFERACDLQMHNALNSPYDSYPVRLPRGTCSVWQPFLILESAIRSCRSPSDVRTTNITTPVSSFWIRSNQDQVSKVMSTSENKMVDGVPSMDNAPVREIVDTITLDGVGSEMGGIVDSHLLEMGIKSKVALPKSGTSRKTFKQFVTLATGHCRGFLMVPHWSEPWHCFLETKQLLEQPSTAKNFSVQLMTRRFGSEFAILAWPMEQGRLPRWALKSGSVVHAVCGRMFPEKHRYSPMRTVSTSDEENHNSTYEAVIGLGPRGRRLGSSDKYVNRMIQARDANIHSGFLDRVSLLLWSPPTSEQRQELETMVPDLRRRCKA